MSVHLSIRAELRYLVVTDACALVLAELVLAALRRLPMLLSPLASVLLGVLIALGFAADVAIWLWTGARTVELSDNELTVFRGQFLSALTISRTAIARLRVRRFIGVGVVRLRTRSGQRVRICENAFPREEFRRFLTTLETWER